MDETTGTTEDLENQAQVDPWAAAFASLEQRGQGNGEEPADTGAGDVPGGELGDSSADSGDAGVSAQAEDIDSTGNQDDLGGLDPDAGDAGSQGRTAFDDKLGVNDEAIAQYEQALNDGIREQAMNDIAQEFLKRNIRQRNGVLGATLDDDDICKRDSDGVPHFYNPETGREFTGDNPRAQAREWVDEYNRALADAFNKACANYENHLREQAQPSIEVMKFAPKYEKLDDIRRGMFDNVIEDYEIKDSQGRVVGYSCDLDKALALVDRQISMIQGYAKRYAAEQKPAPTSPALDMKTSSGAVPNGNQTPVNSLEEAMLRIQDAELAKLKK